jgi:hypothetical protein
MFAVTPFQKGKFTFNVIAMGVNGDQSYAPFNLIIGCEESVISNAGTPTSIEYYLASWGTDIITPSFIQTVTFCPLINLQILDSTSGLTADTNVFTVVES